MTKPLLDRKATDQLNLAVLRRVDPDTEQVLTTAGHVALYGFDTDKKAWSRKDVEGSLFLLKRQSQPRFRIVILNKKSQDNFVEDILTDFKFEVASPYILYRSKTDEVIGIWFYDEHESAMVSSLLQRITSAYTGQNPPEQSAAQADTSNPESSLLSPLHEAFWDKRHTEAAPRAKLLQPTHPSATGSGASASTVSPPALSPAPSASSQPGPSSDGNAPQSPFGLVGNPLPEEAPAAHSQSHTAQGNVLNKLLGSSGGVFSGSPRSHSTPGQLPGSPDQQKAAPAGEEQRGQNPLSALFANMKVSNMGTPTAQEPPPHLKPSSSMGPPANSPALLTPSFFRQHSNPQESSQASTSESMHQETGNSLQQVFARAASRTTPRTDPSDASVQSQLFPAQAPPQRSSTRDKVRQVMLELANSDAFLDIIADKLQTKGLQL